MTTKRKPWPIDVATHDEKIAAGVLPSDALKLLDGSGWSRVGTVEIRGYAPAALADPAFWAPVAGLLTPGSRLFVTDYGTSSQPALQWHRDALVVAVLTDADGWAVGLQVEVLAAWDRPAAAKARAA